MTQTQPPAPNALRKTPFHERPFSRAIDDAAGRIARAPVMTVVAVGCAYIAYGARTWTFFTLGVAGTSIAALWVVVQVMLAYSAAKASVRALPDLSGSTRPVSKTLEVVLAAVVIVPLTLSVAMTASKALENAGQLTMFGGGQ